MSEILIVDDNEQNLYMLESLLRGQYKVKMAHNGEEALNEALMSPPDLIITDVLMPVMDGFQLCLRWRSTETLRRIPLIFYTATYTEPQDEKFAMSIGVDRFIVKPQRPELLLNTISEVLAESKGEDYLPDLPKVDFKALQEYNEILFRKLQKKVIQLETEIAHRKMLQENERRAHQQIERNLEQMAALNDQIRNPLTVIVARMSLVDDSKTKEQVLEAVRTIDEILKRLDEGYADSTKVREFLRKHDQISKEG
ncbi:MAG: response regulator PleD [Methanomassiliicoccales archaeon PtaU1.Bin124]|nr:MAG: response regulator PleD [Methanomassiliicoccales archaeon PtaU1.Bin124]